MLTHRSFPVTFNYAFNIPTSLGDRATVTIPDIRRISSTIRAAPMGIVFVTFSLPSFSAPQVMTNGVTTPRAALDASHGAHSPLERREYAAIALFYDAMTDVPCLLRASASEAPTVVVQHRLLGESSIDRVLLSSGFTTSSEEFATVAGRVKSRSP